MIYAADGPATALLETLVHIDQATLITTPYVLFEITLDPDLHLLRFSAKHLPSDWRDWPWPASTQEVGSFWFETQASVVLEVPSAVVPFHANYLINQHHPDFAGLTISAPQACPIDTRLGKRGVGSS